MIVRRGKEHDIILASRLWLDMVKELAPDCTPNVSWWRETARRSMRMGTYTMFVAEEGGKLAGFGDFFIWPEPATGKVHMIGQHLYVKPEFRNTAIPGKLYASGIKAAKKKGATVFELFCFEKEQQMWNKKGYRPIRTLMRRTTPGGISCSTR